MIVAKQTTLNHATMLYEKLTQTKAELHELAKTFGIVHELTVAKSQELDLVVNEYMNNASFGENTQISY